MKVKRNKYKVGQEYFIEYYMAKYKGIKVDIETYGTFIHIETYGTFIHIEVLEGSVGAVTYFMTNSYMDINSVLV